MTDARTGGGIVAVDLGASSGRVIVGRVGPELLELEEVHRFPNGPVALPDGLHWDVLGLYREILAGLTEAARHDGLPISIGVDTWGVDYALLDAEGALVGSPYHYRDARTDAAIRAVEAIAPPERRYTRTGTQHLPFNTVFQLVDDHAHGRLERVTDVLLMPDLMGFWLTGVRTMETTNASTTGLFDPATRAWATDLIEALALPVGLLREPQEPGTMLGPIRPAVAESTGLDSGTPVVLVGSHDTASAVVAVPASDNRFAYIACGTWSLVGVELAGPVRTEASRLANFTNELGVDGRTRFLRNVMGLWLLQESTATWEHDGQQVDLDDLLAAASREPAGGPTIDPDLPVFLPPGDMPRRIDEACRAAGLEQPRSQPAVVRCILDSLALAYARAVVDAERLSGRAIEVVHVVGGGSRNQLLCQLTADACARPVVAGPVEATAIGNVLVQARAIGQLQGSLETLRSLVRATTALERYEPRATGNRLERAG